MLCFRLLAQAQSVRKHVYSVNQDLNLAKKSFFY